MKPETAAPPVLHDKQQKRRGQQQGVVQGQAQVSHKKPGKGKGNQHQKNTFRGKTSGLISGNRLDLHVVNVLLLLEVFLLVPFLVGNLNQMHLKIPLVFLLYGGKDDARRQKQQGYHQPDGAGQQGGHTGDQTGGQVFAQHR